MLLQRVLPRFGRAVVGGVSRGIRAAATTVQVQASQSLGAGAGAGAGGQHAEVHARRGRWWAGAAAAATAAAATASTCVLNEESSDSSEEAQSGNGHGTANGNGNGKRAGSPGTVEDGIGGLKVFSGRANQALATEIAHHLRLGGLGKITCERFPDGECRVVVNENVRGKDVYIIQPTCPPVNENLMELFLLVSTMRRASARKITAVIPYYGYARQDRKMQARVPISAADVARLLEAMGVDRVVAVDLHCGQIQGFFGPRVPVDNLDGASVGASYFGDMDLVNPVVVSPDAGGVYRAKKFREILANRFDMDPRLAMIIKQRAKASEIESMDLVGNVADSDVIIVDDMIDTAGTLCKAATVLRDKGARRVYAFASHGIFSHPANNRIQESVLDKVVVLDTVPEQEWFKDNPKIHQLSVAHLLAQAIYNIHNKKSISALFK